MSDHGQETRSGLLGVEGMDVQPEDAQVEARDSRLTPLHIAGGETRRCAASQFAPASCVIGSNSGNPLVLPLEVVCVSKGDATFTDGVFGEAGTFVHGDVGDAGAFNNSVVLGDLLLDGDIDASLLLDGDAASPTLPDGDIETPLLSKAPSPRLGAAACGAFCVIAHFLPANAGVLSELSRVIDPLKHNEGSSSV